MSIARVLALSCTAAFCVCASAASPFDSLKGKMKEGLYEYKMEMDMGAMPGMPPGMGRQNLTFQHCLTQQDIEQGRMGKKDDMPKDCEVRNFRTSGNGAAYTMVCKGEMSMTSDVVMTFVKDGYNMDMKSTMNHGGETMKMNQKMQGRLLGPCKK